MELMIYGYGVRRARRSHWHVTSMSRESEINYSVCRLTPFGYPLFYRANCKGPWKAEISLIGAI